MQTFLQSILENLQFLAVCTGIIIALSAAAHIAEHFLPGKRMLSPARRLTIIAICAALAAVLHILDFSVPFLAPEFYKLDFSELPVLLCSFYLGPSASVFCEALKILLKLLFKGTSTAFVGDFANFAIGCAMVLPASICYHIKKSKRTAILGLITGTIFMTVFGSLFNAIYLLPKFSQLYGLPLDTIVAMGTSLNSGIHSVGTLVLLSVAPLNLIKGGVVSVLTLLLYKHLERPLFGKLS